MSSLNSRSFSDQVSKTVGKATATLSLLVTLGVNNAVAGDTPPPLDTSRDPHAPALVVPSVTPGAHCKGEGCGNKGIRRDTDDSRADNDSDTALTRAVDTALNALNVSNAASLADDH